MTNHSTCLIKDYVRNPTTQLQTAEKLPVAIMMSSRKTAMSRAYLKMSYYYCCCRCCCYWQILFSLAASCSDPQLHQIPLWLFYKHGSFIHSELRCRTQALLNQLKISTQNTFLRSAMVKATISK